MQLGFVINKLQRSIHSGYQYSEAMQIFSFDNPSQLGVAILRVTPLVMSSASLMLSWAQDISLGALLHPSLRDDPAHPSGKILPRFLPAFMRPGIWGLGLTYLPATVLCLINGFSDQSSEVRHLYFAGAFLSIAHFCWAPSMLAILRRIQDPITDGFPTKAHSKGGYLGTISGL